MTIYPTERFVTVVFSFFEGFKPLFSRVEFESFVIFVTALRQLFFDDWSKPLYFYLDDSLVEKAGKKVRAEFNYSSTLDKVVPSNCFVFGLVKNGGLTLRFDFSKYYKAANLFKSKIDLALMRSFLRWAEKIRDKLHEVKHALLARLYRGKIKIAIG